MYSRAMGVQKSGKLRHAPLLYTLAMLRFENQQIGSEQSSKIRAELEKEFPRFDDHKIKAVRTQLADEVSIESEEITEYHGENLERTSGFLLRNDGLFFHTIDYVKYEAFEKSLKKVLRIVHKVLKFEYYQAVGIRYIDYIRLGSLDAIDDYVQKGLLGFPINNRDMKATQTVCETIAERGEFAIRLRCSKVPGRVFPIPVDLQPLTRHLDVMAKLPPKPPDEDVILLDTDCFHKQLELREFDLTATLEKFDEMHNIASSVFKAAVTGDAWKEWKGE